MEAHVNLDHSQEPAARSGSGGSGWSPLRYQTFRRWWLDQLTSNVGSWMQTVAAQWVMTSLTTSALLVGAIQATNLPVLLLAVPTGVLGDLVDRKRLVLAGQAVMMVAAAALGGLAAAGLVTPVALLLLLSAIGVGQGLTGPTVTTLQPELVPPAERPQAIALGSVNQNLARAVGPAIGGALLAATSAAAVFFVNAASFIAVVLVIGLTAIPVRTLMLPREHLGAATRAGARFIANSPALIAIMVRAAAFAFFAAGVWALLPLVARRTLGLGSGGYGLLLGCVGIGALLGATYSPALRRALSPRALVAACAAAVAGPTLVLAASHDAVLDGAGLVLTGGGWIIALGLFSASFQSILPDWVKARAMAYYLIAFQGAMGGGRPRPRRRGPGGVARHGPDRARRWPGPRHGGDVAPVAPAAGSDRGYARGGDAPTRPRAHRRRRARRSQLPRRAGVGGRVPGQVGPAAPAAPAHGGHRMAPIQ